MTVKRIPPEGGGPGTNDHSLLINLGSDDHLQYWNNARGATQVGTLIAAQRPTRWIEVDPGLTASVPYRQYPDIASALTAADALVLSLGEQIGVRVSGLLKPTGILNINSFVTLEFESGSNLDFSLWAGGSQLFQMKGVYASLINPPLAQGFSGPHPFTGGNWIKVVDEPALLTYALISGMLFWDTQGGATRAIQVDGTLAGNPVNLFLQQGNISHLTTLNTVDVVGNAKLNCFATKLDVIGEAIRLRTDGTTHANLTLNSNNYIYAIGGYNINADVAGNVLSLKGSFFDLGNVNNVTYGAGDVPSMLNEAEIFQQSFPNFDYADPKSHSLQSGLEELGLRIHGGALSPARGHAHTGADSMKVSYNDLLNLPLFDEHFMWEYSFGWFANATHSIIGNLEQMAVGQIVSGVSSPVIANANRNRIMFNITSVVATGTLRITGTSYDPATGATTLGDTEDIAVTSTGYYDSVKYFEGSITLSSVSGLSIVTTVYRYVTPDKLGAHSDIKADLLGLRYQWSVSNPSNDFRFELFLFDKSAKTFASIFDVTISSLANGTAGFNSRYFGLGVHNVDFPGGDSLFGRVTVQNVAAITMRLLFSPVA